MEAPLELVFEGMETSEAVERRVRKEVEKLERFYDRITGCRVSVIAPRHHKNKGGIYQVRIHMVLPGGAQVGVTRSPGADHAHEDVYVAVRDAFKAARRQLQDHLRKRGGKVKHHEPPPHGAVIVLNGYEGYGILRAPDGQEIYFHRNSVSGGQFDKLEIGDPVRYAVQPGEKGPQATIVTKIGKHNP